MTPPWLDREAWPFPPKLYDDPEGRMHYIDVGRGPTVLFVHGTPTWAFEWRHLVAGLSDRARCIAVDHLGFGLSDRPDGAAYGVADHVARFSRFADHLDLSDATIVVHDFGGPIALPWVLDHLDRVRRVVVVNTWAWSLADQPRFATPARWLDSGFGRWLYGALNVSLLGIASTAWADRRRWKAVSSQYLPVFPDYQSRVKVLWELGRGLLTATDHYANLDARLGTLRDTPLTVMWGTRDPAFPPDVRDRWFERVPHAERLDLDEAGHWPHEEQPEPMVRQLLASL